MASGLGLPDLDIRGKRREAPKMAPEYDPGTVPIDLIRWHQPETEAAVSARAPRETIAKLQNSGQAFFRADVLESQPSLPSPRNGRSQNLARSTSAFGQTPIRRKPLSPTASPLAMRYSSRGYFTQHVSLSLALDSATHYEFPEQPDLLPSIASALRPAVLTAAEQTLPPSQTSDGSPWHNIPDEVHLSTSVPAGFQMIRSEVQLDDRAAQDSKQTPHYQGNMGSKLPLAQGTNSTESSAVPPFKRNHVPQRLSLGFEESNKHFSATCNPNQNWKPHVSSSSGISGYSSSPASTDFNEDKQDYSPLPSPLSTKSTTGTTESHNLSALTHKDFLHNYDADTVDQSPLDYCEAYLQTPPGPQHSQGEIEEMEDELKAISAELASSIRREMDLEDLVDRLQYQIQNPQLPGRRTSDYFSDSGYSSAKLSDYDQVKDEVTQVQRRAEQEKALIRLELTSKLQDERKRRRDLGRQIRALSRKAAKFDAAQVHNTDVSGRVKELESTCGDLRRRLSEERQVKDNFEDLFMVLQGELEATANERDNIRDEIVPHVRACVEDLEAEAVERAKMAYDSTKLQQELQSLRTENREHKNSAEAAETVAGGAAEAAVAVATAAAASAQREAERAKREAAMPQRRTEPLADLPQPLTRSSMRLARANSVATGSYKKNRPASLASSSTLTGEMEQPREIFAEKLKDVEAQRDALHDALKNLLERQEYQTRENNKKIKALEMERDRLLTASPKKSGYEKEVADLRKEIAILRRRAEDAMEQKWRVEKGLGGLKMDLDRVNEDIASLRVQLKEKDILSPGTLGRLSTISYRGLPPVTSGSLEKAYKELQAVYSQALARIRSFEAASSERGPDERTKLAMERLEQSLAQAVLAREGSQSEVEKLTSQVYTTPGQQKASFETERDLADQLNDSARRIAELAQQVRNQLVANQALRGRLTDAVSRGEADQRASKQRIASIQMRLQELEKQLVETLSAAEDRVARHEEELATLRDTLRDTRSNQLFRLREATGSMRSPRLFPPMSPLSPMFSASGPRSPRRPGSAHSARFSLTSKRGGRRGSSNPLTIVEEEAAQVVALRAGVNELEDALASADTEMQEIVRRINMAQIEGLTLQEEREDAVRETRRLRRQVEEEKLRAIEGRFATISTEALS